MAGTSSTTITARGFDRSRMTPLSTSVGVSLRTFGKFQPAQNRPANSGDLICPLPNVAMRARRVRLPACRAENIWKAPYPAVPDQT